MPQCIDFFKIFSKAPRHGFFSRFFPRPQGRTFLKIFSKDPWHEFFQDFFLYSTKLWVRNYSTFSRQDLKPKKSHIGFLTTTIGVNLNKQAEKNNMRFCNYLLVLKCTKFPIFLIFAADFETKK